MTLTAASGLSTHGIRDPIKMCVLTNVCPNCDQSYSSLLGAKLHLGQSYKTGRCLTGRTHFEWKIQTPVSRDVCPFVDCQLKIGSDDHLLQHIRTQLPEPRPLDHWSHTLMAGSAALDTSNINLEEAGKKQGARTFSQRASLTARAETRFVHGKD